MKYLRKKLIEKITENNPDWIPYAIMVSTITSLPLLAFVKEEYNRAIHDQTISETTTPTSSVSSISQRKFLKNSFCWKKI